MEFVADEIYSLQSVKLIVDKNNGTYHPTYVKMDNVKPYLKILLHRNQPWQGGGGDGFIGCGF